MVHYKDTKGLGHWLLALNLQVFIYNGNLDLICNTLGILRAVAAMKNWSQRDQFQRQEPQPLIIKNETIGFFKSAGNLQFVGIDNAGHFVPIDQPEIALSLIDKFLNRPEVELVG